MAILLLRLVEALLVPTLGTRLTVMLATLALVHVVEALVVEVDAIIPGTSMQVLACITSERMEISGAM